MGQCRLCQKSSPRISGRLGICLECIRGRPEEAVGEASRVHAQTREPFHLPPTPPRDVGGLPCGVCANDCVIGEGERGYCGLVSNVKGRLTRFGGTKEKGVAEWYYDPLPTNCVSWWFCPGCTGAGYPKYAYGEGPELGRSNLAVFYGSCTLDCLYCQNWHHRLNTLKLQPLLSSEALAMKVDEHVSCICYFGGDPSSQMPHALATSEMARERRRGSILRICWETNGLMKGGFAERAMELSVASGGNMKFDLKAHSEPLSLSLTGVSNRATLENFELLGRRFFEARIDPPVLTASTLLVPGYVDGGEVKGLAEFVASTDPRIPYTLLAFHPHYVMNDLPTTSRLEAEECLAAAKRGGLTRVRLGNIHLLS